ncbi:MAG: GspH/FimT family pseudopilin [Candidatus Electrothrix sp. GW3-4]|uniref:pilus assembly FimT family protein n=1 Tax=Candidatus Electrothrix sp. GW3-4 TaxID=3126740 RepID=UPI0030CC0C69
MKRFSYAKQGVHGFTLVELMLVISLFAVLSAASIPSLLRGVPEKRLKSAVRNVYADLQKARLLAVKKNKKVIVRFNETDGYYYIDEDEKDTAGYKEWNPDEMRRDLADYGGVIYGKGSAEKNWNNDVINRVVPYNDISFKTTGTATQASVYLQYQDENNITYAVTTTNYGTVKVRKFSGSAWE